MAAVAAGPPELLPDFPGGELVVASHNAGKVAEIADLLKPWLERLAVRVVSAAEKNLPEPEETGASFAANAELKAVAAAQTSARTALADDSGLAVAALDGEPGLYSARWAGPERDFGRAMKKVEDELARRLGGAAADRPANRRAAFVCALCLAVPDGRVRHFEGRVEGTLVWPPRGGLGFGYDPMFQPDGYHVTFGEMAPDLKHAISHRARAFARLAQACFGQ